MATIPSVADNELIETAWGNLVATELNSNTLKTTGNQTKSGNLTITSLLRVDSGARFGTSGGSQVVAADTSGGHNVGISFYGQATGTATVGELGDRSALVGFTSANNFRVLSDRSGADMTIETTGVADIILRPRGDGIGRFSDFGLLLGKSTSGIGTSGVELATDGRIRSTTAIPGSTGYLSNLIGDKNADGEDHFVFNHGGSPAGSIKRSSAGSVSFNTSSDRRLKDIVGDIETPVDRLMQLKPRHLRWKDSRGTFDGFLADEVAAVVPDAVSGAPDAVSGPDQRELEPGTILPQQLDATRLIPLLVAAVQQLTARVTELEAALP